MSLDDLQAQLRGAIDQQFAALKQRYEQAIADARREAAAEAERQAAAHLGAARSEWESQLQTLIDATRSEAHQQASEAFAAERDTLKQQFEQDAEQKVSQAVASAKRGAELELESERRRAQHEIEGERARAEQDLEAERQRAAGEAEHAKAEIDRARGEVERAKADVEALRQEMQTQIASARASAAAAATAAAAAAAAAVKPQPVDDGAAHAALATAVRAIDTSKSVSQTLESLLHHAGAIAGRAALFLINGDRLKAWKSTVIPEEDVQTVESSIGGRDLLARAIQAGQGTLSSTTLPAPPFARLPIDRPAFAVPLMVAGRAVAVLYADGGTNGAAKAGWTDAVDLLMRHTSALAALRTAVRTLDVLGGKADAPADDSGNGNTEESARRYAKLLVSEIKLYNEAAVKAGRQQRDLLTRLRSEIDRAQRLFEERVPPAVVAREQYFRQELVQTLADGDPTLLGN
jgi:hypothetical protein